MLGVWATGANFLCRLDSAIVVRTCESPWLNTHRLNRFQPLGGHHVEARRAKTQTGTRHHHGEVRKTALGSVTSAESLHWPRRARCCAAGRGRPWVVGASCRWYNCGWSAVELLLLASTCTSSLSWLSACMCEFYFVGSRWRSRFHPDLCPRHLPSSTIITLTK